MAAERPRHLNYAGRSMWPCFQDGDILELTIVDAASLRIGDCISFRSGAGDTIYTHRICSLNGGLHTRGDAHAYRDDTMVDPDRIVGRVTGVIRLGSHHEVASGWCGRLLALFYHSAGRIDPTRTEGRGGRLARGIRVRLQWRAAVLYRRGETKSFPSNEGKLVTYWLIDGTIRARKNDAHWSIPWPWSLLLDETRLP